MAALAVIESSYAEEPRPHAAEDKFMVVELAEDESESYAKREKDRSLTEAARGREEADRCATPSKAASRLPFFW
jgi:hypothetical protein